MQIVEVIHIEEIDGKQLVTLKHVPGFSVWGRTFLSKELNKRWQVTNVDFVEISREIQQTSICILEPVDHHQRLSQGMILYCGEVAPD